MKTLLKNSTPLLALALAGATLAFSAPAQAHGSHTTVVTPTPVVVNHAPVHRVQLPSRAYVSPYEGQLVQMDGLWWTLLDGAFYRVSLMGSQWILMDAAYMPLPHVRLARHYGFFTTPSAYGYQGRGYAPSPRVVYLNRRYHKAVNKEWKRWKKAQRRDARMDRRQERRNDRIERRDDRRDDRRDNRNNGRNNGRGNNGNNGRSNGRGNGHGRI